MLNTGVGFMLYVIDDGEFLRALFLWQGLVNGVVFCGSARDIPGAPSTQSQIPTSLQPEPPRSFQASIRRD